MDPIAVAEEVQSLMAPLARKKGLLIKHVYNLPLPVRINSDPLRIKQILINLCDNAIKFTDHGSITMTLEFDRDRNQMKYSVKDSGIGVSTEQQQRIFEAFKQTDSSITRRFRDTGLGLSLSSRLAELPDGSLCVNSKLNQGSEFILTVDAGAIGDMQFIDSPDQLNEIQLDKSMTVLEYKKLQGRVLLAEDNVSLQGLLSMKLGKFGLLVDLAVNGSYAISMAQEHHYDLLLLDMQMPALSGLDAARQLRASGYMQPIVALTANTTQEDRRLCLEAGCNEFLSKPVTDERLYACLERFLKKHTDSWHIQPLHSNLLDEGPEFEEIVRQFIIKLPDTINSIDLHFRKDDRTKLREVVHNLKGMGGGFGFPQLTEHAAEIEKLMQQGDMQAVEPLVESLQEICQRIEAGLPGLLAKGKRDVG